MINCHYYTWIDEVKCLDKINKIIDKKSVIYDQDFKKAKYSTKTSTVKYIDYNHLSKFLNDYVVKALSVNSDCFGYNLFSLSPTTVLNVNYYSENEKYEWHFDSSQNPVNDVKLTLLINISEKKYQGGEFQVFLSENPETINSFSKGGDMILLKSSILHRVIPIIKGMRKSLTIFFEGPKFQ
tara:strand:- start:42 stop:587 length:546 start_codon:yes stop_codon:yes gene_type:complete